MTGFSQREKQMMEFTQNIDIETENFFLNCPIPDKNIDNLEKAQKEEKLKSIQIKEAQGDNYCKDIIEGLRNLLEDRKSAVRETLNFIMGTDEAAELICDILFRKQNVISQMSKICYNNFKEKKFKGEERNYEHLQRTLIHEGNGKMIEKINLKGDESAGLSDSECNFGETRIELDKELDNFKLDINLKKRRKKMISKYYDDFKNHPEYLVNPQKPWRIKFKSMFDYITWIVTRRDYPKSDLVPKPATAAGIRSHWNLLPEEERQEHQKKFKEVITEQVEFDLAYERFYDKVLSEYRITRDDFFIKLNGLPDITKHPCQVYMRNFIKKYKKRLGEGPYNKEINFESILFDYDKWDSRWSQYDIYQHEPLELEYFDEDKTEDNQVTMMDKFFNVGDLSSTSTEYTYDSEEASSYWETSAGSESSSTGNTATDSDSIEIPVLDSNKEGRGKKKMKKSIKLTCSVVDQKTNTASHLADKEIDKKIDKMIIDLVQKMEENGDTTDIEALRPENPPKPAENSSKNSKQSKPEKLPVPPNLKGPVSSTATVFPIPPMLSCPEGAKMMPLGGIQPLASSPNPQPLFNIEKPTTRPKEYGIYADQMRVDISSRHKKKG
ncbi:unnamed protein product [Moneuplotes crassus]|uniref:Uncharacterized protein n=1 Tax=Euplotes crassus TaxID=5936 RepID=A0AAD1X764_EUPCR|nr:unnamed protein product [Moneuplotes crassus]